MMDKGMQVVTVAALVTIALSAMGIAGSMDAQDQANQTSLYCEMREIHKETKGEYGWPDYRGDAAEVCE